MTLPPKRKSKSSRRPKKRWPAHRKWVRSHKCALWQSGECDGEIQCAHVRTETDGGISMKPGDDWTISLCAHHHRLQHTLGEPEFERQYGIDMKELAQEFAQKSPKAREMRQARDEWAELTEGLNHEQ